VGRNLGLLPFVSCVDQTPTPLKIGVNVSVAVRRGPVQRRLMARAAHGAARGPHRGLKIAVRAAAAVYPCNLAGEAPA
jgi:hypothetical protein